MYKTNIRYEKNIISFNVHSIKLSGSYMLPDFLKHVRLMHGHDFGIVHMRTDYPEEECEQFENNKLPITQDYLKVFAEAYKLPKKLAKLGINEKQESTLELANRLYQLRTKSNRTQLDIAYSIGVARTTYASYETGQNEPDLRTLIKIAKLYDTSLDSLVGGLNY